MRGGFVACAGTRQPVPEHIVQRLRWHQGEPLHHHANGLSIAACVDPAEGPTWSSQGDRQLLVHGDAGLASMLQLQQHATRFAALEWDGRLLRAARDPFGLAPLFYRQFDGAVWLASEVGPLLALGPTGPDLEALSARAAFVPLDERTGWLGIHRVLPGNTLEVQTPGQTPRSARFWFPEQGFGRYQGSYQDALAEFRARFATAVQRCYAPGSAILLSGGVDSAAVAVTARAQGAELPHLLHVHFANLPKTYEHHFAAAVADRVGTRLHTVEGVQHPWDIDAELDMHGIPYNWLPYGMDEPALAHIAAAGIRVALDGHDGDGVLGPPGQAVWGNLALQAAWPRLWQALRRQGAMRALRGLASDFVPVALRPRRHRPQTYTQNILHYFQDPIRTRMAEDDIYRWRWPAERWRARQLQPLLPRAVVSFEQKEIEAASHGIDLRHPFADRDLVDFLISLPCAVKSDPGRAKPVLVDALREELPEPLLARGKSDYMAAVGVRVDAARCIDIIRASGIELPHINYQRLLDDAASRPADMPLFLLVNLARVHAFAARGAKTPGT